MKETTTHCDYCGDPLGIKCDRTAPSAVRAKLKGIWVCCEFIKSGLNYRFFCSLRCTQNCMIDEGKLFSEKKIHEMQDEKEKGSS